MSALGPVNPGTSRVGRIPEVFFDFGDGRAVDEDSEDDGCDQLCDVHRYWVEGTVLYGRSTRKKNGDLLIANIVIDDITKFF